MINFEDPTGGKRHPLAAFFKPRSVAVIGATDRPNSVGQAVLANLGGTPFGGKVYAVNPGRSTVEGKPVHANIGAVPGPVDLAVIATPAATVPGVVAECAAAGVQAAVILSAGFREASPEGARLEEEILRTARAARMRIVGPNCLGVMVPPAGLNATFAPAMARTGSVALLSQSGALLTALLDWGLQEGVGFSAVVSLGSMLDVGFGDLIEYLGTDGRTKSILIHMESVGDARAFLSAAREVSLRKPIIVLKGGRTKAAAAAAVSHTGALVCSDAVLDAAFRRTGVLRVNQLADLFAMADTLARQPRPRGRKLAIVTNAGGPGVLAADALVHGKGELAPLSPGAKTQLDALLPPEWSHGNPIDVLHDADPARYEQALRVAVEEPSVDGVLVILTPQKMADPTLTAERVKSVAQLVRNKPILASWMGAADVAAGRGILASAGVPVFDYPDTAARVFNYMWHWSYNLRGLYETPSLTDEAEGGHERGAAILAAARKEGRTLLSELESKSVLAAYGISTVETRLAVTPDEAVREAESLGYPVAVKLHSRSVAHKSDVGGVHLDVRSAEGVRAAFEAIENRLEALGLASGFEGVTVQPMVRRGGIELIVGSSIEPQFGPVLVFGAGGVFVDAFEDRAWGLPPLNTTLARRMMEQTRIFRALRDRADVEALQRLLVRFGQLVLEQPVVREIDVNPLVVSEHGLVALDARIVLHAPEVTQFPRPAIKPYPTQYIGTLTMRTGEVLRVRPIRPEDEPRMVDFHRTLSAQTVYQRYMGMLNLDLRVAHDRLAQICFVDYDREMALVAQRADGTLLAVGRLTRIPGTLDAEFALLISDDVQGKGIGRGLLSMLFQVGRDWGLESIVAEILPDNVPMRTVCRALGFKFDGSTHARKIL